MEFQLSYFKSWKMMLWKCCTQYASKFGKLSRGHRTGKGQFSFQSQRRQCQRMLKLSNPKEGNAKECSNYHTIALISHTSKVILKILKARLQQYMNHELPDVQAGFRKGRGTRDQIANIHGIIEKAREFQKNIYFCFIDYALLTMNIWITYIHICDHIHICDSYPYMNIWITINCGKFWKRWEYQITWPASWETYMLVRKQQLELDMEQQTGSK